MNYKPGIYSGISETEYRSIDAINKSKLDDLKITPKNFYSKHIVKENVDETKDYLELGSAVHCAILEPKKFPDNYIFAPQDLDRRTSQGKSEWSKLELSGKRILSHKDSIVIEGIVKSLSESHTLTTLLSDTKVEQTLIWIDPDTGIKCKARADAISADNSVMIDLKTSKSADESEFSRSCFIYGYHRQADWYSNGLRILTGSAPKLFVFIVVEKTAPYLIAGFYASYDMIEQGREENAKLLALYKKCLDENNWPGYPSELRELNLPAWSKKMFEPKEIEINE